MELQDVRTIKNPTNWKIILMFNKGVSVDITIPNLVDTHTLAQLFKKAVHEFTLRVGE